jgi:type VI secretion system protein ImpK
LGRGDSADLADLIEIHYLCLLLGFSGRYSAGNRGELAQMMNLTGEKIRRIRGHFGPLSPAWQPPTEKAVSQTDPWVKRWGIIAAVCAGVTLLLFVGYWFGLGSVVSQLRTLSTQGKG